MVDLWLDGCGHRFLREDNMTIRELITKLMEQGDIDAEVQIKVITRNPGRHLEAGTLASCKHVPISFVYSTEASISIEQSAIDSASVEER